MTLLDITAVLFVLSALFGFLNHKVLKLPHTVGIVVIALLASGAIVVAELLMPSLEIGKAVRDVLAAIDFHGVVLEGFLCALLFAGAVHVDLTELAERKWAIGLMATIGVLISTFLVGGAVYYVSSALGVAMPFIWALVFGALISPTDPVAVLGILKRVQVPRLLEAKIAGESLLNDGVGVVVFTIIVAIATGTGAHGGGEVGALDAIKLFALEAVGGGVLGLAAGWIAYRLLRAINEHTIEVMITLALVTGAYALAIKLHLSGPIAVVVAGLLIGNHGARFGMSENSRRHVFEFWELVDEILNTVLFLLIGLEVLVLGLNPTYGWLALAAIPIVLVARLIAVAIPIGLLSLRERFTDGAIRILTWAGLRGGISVALALSLPDNPYKGEIITATYAVVVFSIIVQGLTTEPLVRSIVTEARRDPTRPMAATAHERAAASDAAHPDTKPSQAGDHAYPGSGKGKRAKRRDRGRR